MIDPAADLGAIFASGDFPVASGTVFQDGEEHAFARGLVHDRRRVGGGGDRDVDSAQFYLPAAELAVEFKRESIVTLAGETEEQAWRVVEVTPYTGPNGAVFAWGAALRRDLNRSA